MTENNVKLKKLQMLLATSELLNSNLDTNTILDMLLAKSLELTDGADTGAIFLYNPDDDALVMKAFKGMGDAVKNIRLKPGESMTGIAFKEKKALFFKSSESIQNAMATMSKANTQLAVQGNVIASNAHGSICCPLVYRNDVIGVLVVDNFNPQNRLKDEDVDFLKAISVQATIAIINAQNYETEIENNRKLEKYNEMIRDERNKYKYATNIHTKFTEMILNGSSIEDILAEIKKLVQKNVLVIDIFYNIKHVSIDNPEILVTVNSDLSDLIKHLHTHVKRKFTSSISGIYYNIFPITVNREEMGWLCIFSESNSSFSELDVITAERGSTSLALEILKQNELISMEQSVRGDFLDALILNNNPGYIKKCSQRYGFNLDASHVIVGIEFDMLTDDAPDEKLCDREANRSLQRYYQLINEYLKNNLPNSISLIKGHLIVMVVEISSRSQKSELDRFIDYFEEKCIYIDYGKFNTYNYKIGISDICREISKFKESYYKSMHALSTVDSCNSGKNYAYYKDLEIKKFLMNNDFGELKAFAEKILGPLNEYPNASKDEFIKTLKTYVHTNCNWSETKDILNIHGNTLTYRLNRICEILDLDINSYNDRFRIQMAFEILDLSI